MNHDELDTLAALYAVDALDGADLARFQAHLATGCERCAGLLRDTGATTAARVARRPARSGWLRRAAVGAVAVVIGAGLTSMYVVTRYEARIGQMVRESIAERERLHELVRDPATRFIDLRARDAAPASGRAVWNGTKGGLLLVSGLAPPPAGKAYAAWIVTAGTPRPAGLLRVDARGRAAHRVDPTDGPVEELAVTLEPEAGALAPTGPIVLGTK
jgi:hypothetical protein